MCSRKVMLLLTISLSAGAAAGEAPDPDAWVRQLGSDDFDLRQDALAKLKAMGEAARGVLLKARHSDILEVRSNAERLLANLNRVGLTIKIVDDKGKPIVGEPVGVGLTPCWQLHAQQPAQTILTDKDGGVRLERDNSGPHLLDLECGDKERRDLQWRPKYIHLCPGENRALWVRSLGATVKGRVVSAETGQPVSGAEILVKPDTGVSPRETIEEWPDAKRDPKLRAHWIAPGQEGFSSDEGTFAIENNRLGVMRVYARHADFAPASSGPLTVTESGEYVLEEPLRLTPKSSAWGRVRLQVLDHSAKAVKEATVKLQPVSLEAAVWEKHGLDLGNRCFTASALIRFHETKSFRFPVLKTDKEGWAQTEWMAPGTYRLIVTGIDAGPDDSPGEVSYDVQVKAGETVVVEGKPPQCGSLKGRFKADKKLEDHEVLVSPLRLDDPLVQQVLKYDGNHKDEMVGCLVERHPKVCALIDETKRFKLNGEFEIKGLRQGEYVLVVQASRHDGSSEQWLGWVFGLEVKSGETTVVPEIDLAEAQDPAKESSLKRLNGIVLGRDGQPLDGVRYMLDAPGSGYGGSVDGGKFRLALDNKDMRNATKLTFYCPGYRPQTLDLRKPMGNPEDFTVHMEPQRYGTAVVTVRDPDGKPLKDVQVAPVAAGSRKPSLERARDTGLTGRAELPGLACGRRQIVASLDGYRLEEAATVDVELDKATNVNITLVPCNSSIKGCVKLPEGVKPAEVLVWLGCSEPFAGFGRLGDVWCSTAIDGEGRFEFSGLAPGKVRLRAQSPGLLSAEVDATIGRDDWVELRLVRPSSLIVHLGEAGRGGFLWIMRSGTWDPAREFDDILTSATPVSSTGRAVFSGLALGTYDLVFSKQTPWNLYIDGKGARQMIASSLKVNEGTSTINVNWQSGTASVRFALRSVDARILYLQSDKAFAFIRTENNNNCLEPRFVRGTPPEGFLTKVVEKGVEKGMLVSDLPAGEYKVLLVGYDTRPLKAFSLKNGEALDLGSIEVESSDAPRSRTALSGLEIGEDKPLK